MRESPPPPLVELLQRLGLATAEQIDRTAPQVRRLARDLPHFESVWVDALAQARILTRYQAAEMNAGRGEALRLGPYVLLARLPWPEYTQSYHAREVETGRPVRLAVVGVTGNRVGNENADDVLDKLQALAADAGIDGSRIYATAPWVEGRSAAEWMVYNGRFPPRVVLQIARATLVGLAVLEKAGCCHGDISASGLILSDRGDVVLPLPGLRAVVRPEEGYAQTDLRPEAYDYLAPERIADGTPPDVAADVYACGCLWWHLLCGRPPLAGGNALAKLRAAQAAEVPDVRRLAGETPPLLVAAMQHCLQREPQQRPGSMAELAAMLGPPTREGKRDLSRCVVGAGRSAIGWPWSMPRRRVRNQKPIRLTAAAACLAIVAAMAWSLWQPRAETDARHEPRPSGRGYDGGDAHRGDDGNTAADNAAAAGGNAVLPAHYLEHVQPESAAASVEDLLLPGDEPLAVASLELQPGQRVRGDPQRRPALLVPAAGLIIDAEDVRFENVDFVYDHPPKADAALVQLRATRAEFRGCRFRARGSTPTPPAAVQWIHPAAGDDSTMSLPSGRLRLVDCVLECVGIGIDCRLVGATALELGNTLHLGTGALLRFDRCPKADEPTRITLWQVTLRESGPLLECVCNEDVQQPGAISIQSHRSVFVPRRGEPLMLLRGRGWPERLLQTMQWSGQGSLVVPGAEIAAWQTTDGRRREVDETAISMAGLVRSEVAFAGDASSDPAASLAVRWQAPLRSPDPPGIDPAALPAGR